MPMLDPQTSVPSRVQALFATMQAIVGASAVSCAIFIVGMTLLGSALDLSNQGESGGGMLALNAAGLVAGFALCRAMLDKSGLRSITAGKSFGAYFGLCIVTGLGTVMGFLLLIVPGVVLLIRWLPAFGFLLGEGEGVSQSLSSSWNRTRGHFWVLLAGSVMPFLLLALAGGSYVMVGMGSAVPDSVWLIAANLAIYASTAGWSAYGIAAYALLKDERNALSDVFG